MAQDLTIKKEILLEAPLKWVWEALTNSQMVKQYMFNCEVESEWKKGSEIIFRDKKRIQAQGIISEIEPGRRLVYTMYDPEKQTAEDVQNHLVVQIDLKSQGNSTRLSIQQGDFSQVDNPEERYSESEAGWNHVIEQLRQLMRDNVTA